MSGPVTRRRCVISKQLASDCPGLCVCVVGGGLTSICCQVSFRAVGRDEAPLWDITPALYTHGCSHDLMLRWADPQYSASVRPPATVAPRCYSDRAGFDYWSGLDWRPRLEGLGLAAGSAVSVIAKSASATGRKSLARSIAEHLAQVTSRTPIEQLLGVEFAPILDVRSYCSTPRAQSVLTVSGLWGTRSLLRSSVSQLHDLHRCGPKTVQEILAALLEALTAPTAQECLPMIEEDEWRVANQRGTTGLSSPLTAEGFMAAIRGRGTVQ